MIRTTLSTLGILLMLWMGIGIPSGQYLSPALAYAGAVHHATGAHATGAAQTPGVGREVAARQTMDAISRPGGAPAISKAWSDSPERYVEARYCWSDPGGPDLILCPVASVTTPVVFQTPPPHQLIRHPSDLQYPQERPPRA